MKKLDLNEEFSLNGKVYMFIPKGESMAIKYVRESKSKPSFQPPTLQEVKDYFKEKGYSEDLAIQMHKSYSAAKEGDFIDSKGNRVVNWKSKCINVWFKNHDQKEKENKATNQTSGLKFFQNG